MRVTPCDIRHNLRHKIVHGESSGYDNGHIEMRVGYLQADPGLSPGDDNGNKAAQSVSPPIRSRSQHDRNEFHTTLSAYDIVSRNSLQNAIRVGYLRDGIHDTRSVWVCIVHRDGT